VSVRRQAGAPSRTGVVGGADGTCGCTTVDLRASVLDRVSVRGAPSPSVTSRSRGGGLEWTMVGPRCCSGVGLGQDHPAAIDRRARSARCRHRAAGRAVVSDPVSTSRPAPRRRTGLPERCAVPHLSVGRNIGYGLGRHERRSGPRIDELAELVAGRPRPGGSPMSCRRRTAAGCAGAGARTPARRAAAGRTFSNLDAVLRERLRDQVRAIVTDADDHGVRHPRPGRGVRAR